MVQQHCLTSRPGGIFGIWDCSATPHAVKHIHAYYATDWGRLGVLDRLHDAVQGAILVPHPSADDILPLIDEAEGEGAQPVYDLASLLTWATLNNVIVRDHGVLYASRRQMRQPVAPNRVHYKTIHGRDKHGQTH